MSDEKGVRGTTTREGADPLSPREDDPGSVAGYLLSFEWHLQNKELFKCLVDGGLPLWLEILRLVPQPEGRGRLLELGSPPFLITLLLQKFRNYDISLTAAAADGRPRLGNTIASHSFGEEYCFDCACFDLERDSFPFPDNQFDVVTWCEVIEHLTENPVFTLNEIHRVLKPGGAVVISTPNAGRIENIVRLCVGENVYDPYHLGALLRGSRHSREYTLPELRSLVSGCGFRIEVAEDRNLPGHHLLGVRRWIELATRWVMQFARSAHRDHLFVRAVKDGPFHWAFPPALFDQGHVLWYLRVSDREVVMGHNDVPHIFVGWGPLGTGPEGKAQRRAGPAVDAYLISHVSVRRVVLEMCGGGSVSAGTVEVWQGEGDLARRLAVGPFEVPPHRWSRFDLPLGSEMRLGERIKVRIAAPSGVDVHRIALEP